ncbi:MAG: CapA family protein [Candidatus Omnitrophica bacterium]|nr:CapA family protein [Candidatus Omnitrophota bacterium]
MMGSNYPENFLPPADGRDLFSEASYYLSQADITFGNLEGPLTEKSKCSKDPSQPNTFVFRTPPRFARNLARSGFDVLSLANNHSRDFGREGLADTKKALRVWGMIGLEEGEIAYCQVKGIKVGLVAFSFSPSPFSISRPEAALCLIQKQAEQCDILLVSFHAGREGPTALHLSEKEEFYCGENRGSVINLGREAIKRGADLVIMHGPHVPRAMEVYQGRLIAYSLGNFCFYGSSCLKYPMNLSPLLLAELDGTGRLVKTAIISFKQLPPGWPKRDRKEQVLSLTRRLSCEDLNQPETFINSGLDFFR